MSLFQLPKFGGGGDCDAKADYLAPLDNFLC